MEIRDRKLETRAVKDALLKVGIKARVGHGHGTAWGWLHVYVGSNPYPHLCKRHGDGHFSDSCCSPEDCLACKWYGTIPTQALKTAMEVTGRHGEYDGRINILTQ